MILDKFDGSEMFYIDEALGLMDIAAAERFGTIVYEDPDEPTYGTIEDILFDDNNTEYVEFQKQLFHSAVCEIVRCFDESEYSFHTVAVVIEKIGAYKERNNIRF